MEVKKEPEGFAIYAPNWLKPKGVIHASFNDAGECRCTFTQFDGEYERNMVDVPFAYALGALQASMNPVTLRPEPGHGC